MVQVVKKLRSWMRLAVQISARARILFNFYMFIQARKGMPPKLTKRGRRAREVTITSVWNTEKLVIYFLRPQCGKSRFLEDSTDNCILEPRKPMSED